MMGKIYSLADHTVIYLNLFNPQDAAKLDGWVSSNFDESQFSTEIAELVLNHTWFRRFWVLQELVSFVYEPPLLACLGSKLDVVARLGN
jgi:hypothetical protein